MNKQRRKILYNISDQLEEMLDQLDDDVDILPLLREVIGTIDSVKCDEEYAMDSMPENLQGSERYGIMEEACSNLEDALDSLQEAIDNYSNKEEVLDYISDAIDSIEEAAM